jgi:hypothetical protein
MAGVDLATVKELMGHKHITMTLRYAYLSSDHKQAAVKKLDKSPSNFHNRPMVAPQVANGNA